MSGLSEGWHGHLSDQVVNFSWPHSRGFDGFPGANLSNYSQGHPRILRFCSNFPPNSLKFSEGIS
jgi:hypothetical protein